VITQHLSTVTDCSSFIIHRPSFIPRWAVAALCIAVSAGCTPTENAPVNPKPAVIQDLPVNSFAAAWRAELPLKTARLQRLMVDDQSVYAYGTDQQLYWIKRAGGELMSMTPVAEAGDRLFNIVSLPDRVVVPSSRQLAILDRTGQLIHTIRLKYPPATGVAGEGTSVFLGIDEPGGERIMALPARTGVMTHIPEWQLLPPSEVKAAPVAFGGTVFLAMVNGAVVALRAEDRGLAWPLQKDGIFRTGGAIRAGIFADKEGVYVPSADSKLYCLDPQDGHAKWSWYAGTPLGEETTPIATATTVYLYVSQLGFVAIEKQPRREIRKPKWIVPEGRQFLAQDDTFAYLRAADNSIIAVDNLTGQVKFRSQRNDFTVFAPNIKDGLVFAGTADGVVWAIRAVVKPGTKGELVLHSTRVNSGA
jgi:outer membrane protein assembly factor BamB